MHVNKKQQPASLLGVEVCQQHASFWSVEVCQQCALFIMWRFIFFKMNMMLLSTPFHQLSSFSIQTHWYIYAGQFCWGYLQENIIILNSFQRAESQDRLSFQVRQSSTAKQNLLASTLSNAEHILRLLVAIGYLWPPVTLINNKWSMC